MTAHESAWKYIATHVVDDLFAAQLPEDVADGLLSIECRENLRRAVATDPYLASTLMQAAAKPCSHQPKEMFRWGTLKPKARRLLASLLKACLAHEEHRPVFKSIITELTNDSLRDGLSDDDDEAGAQIGVMFAAFHAFGGPSDERLVTVIDTLHSQQQRFDGLCYRLYVAADVTDDAEAMRVSEQTLRRRLQSDPNATALYLFNLRDVLERLGREERVQAILEEQLRQRPWPSVRRAVEYLSKKGPLSDVPDRGVVS